MSDNSKITIKNNSLIILTRPIRKFIARIVFFFIDIINCFRKQDPNVYYRFKPAKYMEAYYSKIPKENEKSTIDSAIALGIDYEKISKSEYETSIS